MDQSSSGLNGDLSPVDRNESETVGKKDQFLPAQQGQQPRKRVLKKSMVSNDQAQRNFGADGLSLPVGNYFYLYRQIFAGSATIWIIPTGSRREEGSTHFLLLRPDSLRRWKGVPPSLDEIKGLPAVPPYRQMALPGMTEQEPKSFLHNTF